MVEDKLKYLDEHELENLRVSYKNKIEKASSKFNELSIELESMKDVLESIKKLQKDRSEESYEDWEGDNDYHDDYGLKEEELLDRTFGDNLEPEKNQLPNTPPSFYDLFDD